jgi:hypothetical protein
MDWIKINTTLPRNPKIVRFASLLGCDRHTALGILLEWLCWLDGVSEDGSTGLTAELVDSLFALDLPQNFVTDVTKKRDTCHTVSRALVTIGWATEDENGNFYASEFEKHNGENAKKRTENAERQRKRRTKNVSQNFVTDVTKKRDQIREDNNIYNELHPNESINTVCGGDAAAKVDATREEASSGRKLALPETSDDVLTFLASQPNCYLRGDELLACAEAFFHEFDSVGWVLRGQPIRNWHSAARSFLAKWQNNLASRSAAASSRGRITYRSETNQNYEL